MDFLAYKCASIPLLDGLKIFPAIVSRLRGVVRILIHEIIYRFGLLGSLQSDNASAYKVAVNQKVSKSSKNRISLTLFLEIANLRKN